MKYRLVLSIKKTIGLSFVFTILRGYEKTPKRKSVMTSVPAKITMIERIRTLGSALFYFIYILTPATLVQMRLVTRMQRSLLAGEKDISRSDARTLRKIRMYAVMLPLIAYEYLSMCAQNIDWKDREIAVLIAMQVMLQDAVIDERPEGEFLPRLYAAIKKEVEIRLDPGRVAVYRELLSRFHYLQYQSLRQSDPTVSPREIRDISRKGGITLILSVFPFRPLLSPAEMQALEDLGTWLQYVDDLADKEEDLRSSIYTIATHPQMMDGAFQEAEDKRRMAYKGIRELGFNKKKTERFLFRYYAMLVTYHSYYSIPPRYGSLYGNVHSYRVSLWSGTRILALVLFRSAKALSIYRS